MQVPVGVDVEDAATDFLDGFMRTPLNLGFLISHHRFRLLRSLQKA